MFTDRDDYRRAVADELRWRHLRHMPLPLLLLNHHRLHRPWLGALFKIVVMVVTVCAVVPMLHLAAVLQWLVAIGVVVWAGRIWRRRPKVSR